MRVYVEALWEVISHFGQLQFFVYLWLFTMFFAWWKNNLGVNRLWVATTYVGVTLALLIASMYYRFINVVDVKINGTMAAMATYVFISYVGGMWSALAINKLSLRQRGWLFSELTKTVRVVADYLEKRVDVVYVLRRTADQLEKKAEISDPLNHVQKALELVKEDIS